MANSTVRMAPNGDPAATLEVVGSIECIRLENNCNSDDIFGIVRYESTFTLHVLW